MRNRKIRNWMIQTFRSQYKWSKSATDLNDETIISIMRTALHRHNGYKPLLKYSIHTVINENARLNKLCGEVVAFKQSLKRRGK